MVVKTSPYNFVPLQKPNHEEIHSPDHGKPHKEGLCGELEVEWTFSAPVLVGKKNDKDIHIFTENGNGVPFIQGSTLRGAMRSIVEIITNSKMSIVDREAHFAVRDFSGDDKYFSMALPKSEYNSNTKEMNGGWLVRKENKVFTKHDYDGWELIKAEKHALVSTKSLPFVQIRSLFEKNKISGKYILAKNSNFKHDGAWLVFGSKDPFSDTEPNPKTKKDPAKKDTSLFYQSENEVKINLSSYLMQVFMRANFGATENQDSVWSYWFKKYNDNLKNDFKEWFYDENNNKLPGVPVFLTYEPSSFDFDELENMKTYVGRFQISMSRSMKIPYKYNVGDIIKRDEVGVNAKDLDYAQSLFGRIVKEENNQEDTLKGRVFFGDATLVGDKPQPSPTNVGSASSPRASFFPYYLVPEKEDGNDHPYDYSNGASRIAGWKRYAVRKNQVAFSPETGGNKTEMQFLQAGVKFKGKIKFHNLLPHELGSLIWAIKWGDDTTCHHLIGRGKAQGFGKCQAKIIGEPKITANQGSEPSHETCFEFFKEKISKNMITIENLKALAREASRELVAGLKYPTDGTTNSDATVKGYSAIKKEVKHEPLKFKGRILPLHANPVKP